MQQEDAANETLRVLRIGVVRRLPKAISPTNAGRWYTARDGGRFWLLTIASPLARAIRVHVEHLSIPAGGHLLVFNPFNWRENHGVYRQRALYGSLEIWTASVFAPLVTVEYYLPPHASHPDEVSLQIREIAHQYVAFADLVQSAEGICHNDVTCHVNWKTDANAVGGIGTIGATGILWCTGTLLNDLDPETYEDYFLTANHCLSGSSTTLGTQADANTIEFYWFFQTATCNGVPPNAASVPRTASGADLISRQTRQTGNDHAFLRIRDVTPGAVAYVGWTTASPGNNAALIGIHHPDGAFKRINFGNLADNSTANYWDMFWTSGVTEPGSSGSGIFNTSHQLIGQLFGGFSECDNQADTTSMGAST